MKEIKDKRAYALLAGLVTTTCLFSLLGFHWNQEHYHYTQIYEPSSSPVSIAMMGIHDGLVINELNDFYAWTGAGMSIAKACESTETLNIYAQITNDKNEVFNNMLENPLYYSTKDTIDQNQAVNKTRTNNQVSYLQPDELENNTLESSEKTYEFTTASDSYFSDAVFIGDSRTVGISEYSGIENATFLCRTSLTIYDYNKSKITYNDKKTSIKEVLSTKNFGKIYLMLGINECSYGTTESYYEAYKEVVDDIRSLQPDALIFIEGNLLVTDEKSKSGGGITNEKLVNRNSAISTLANQKDIFYIDINESSLCENQALIPDYTWDHVHIKAQYYTVWKDFLLEHAIVKENVT